MTGKSERQWGRSTATLNLECGTIFIKTDIRFHKPLQEEFSRVQSITAAFLSRRQRRRSCVGSQVARRFNKDWLSRAEGGSNRRDGLRFSSSSLGYSSYRYVRVCGIISMPAAHQGGNRLPSEHVGIIADLDTVLNMSHYPSADGALKSYRLEALEGLKNRAPGSDSRFVHV